MFIRLCLYVCNCSSPSHTGTKKKTSKPPLCSNTYHSSFEEIYLNTQRFDQNKSKFTNPNLSLERESLNSWDSFSNLSDTFENLHSSNSFTNLSDTFENLSLERQNLHSSNSFTDLIDTSEIFFSENFAVKSSKDNKFSKNTIGYEKKNYLKILDEKKDPECRNYILCKNPEASNIEYLQEESPLEDYNKVENIGCETPENTYFKKNLVKEEYFSDIEEKILIEKDLSDYSETKINFQNNFIPTEEYWDSEIVTGILSKNTYLDSTTSGVKYNENITPNHNKKTQDRKSVV